MQEETKEKPTKFWASSERVLRPRITHISRTVQFSAPKKAEQKGTQKLHRGLCKDDGDMPQGKVPSTSRSIFGALEEGYNFQGLGLQGVPGTSPLPHQWKVCSDQGAKLAGEEATG